MSLSPSIKDRIPSFSTILVFSLVIGNLLLYLAVFYIISNSFKASSILPESQECECIVRNLSMSQSYEQNKAEFLAAVKNITTEQVEGHSGQAEGETKMLHYLAKDKRIKTVCETGFNAGHSSFDYLTANDELVVHSFDLGRRKYAHEMSEYMKKKFPGRFFIHFGDSVKTVPKFIEENPDVKCDLMFVDGGHTYPVAQADMKNFARMANLKGNIIMFDDHPAHWSKEFGKAWDDLVIAGLIEEKTRCTFFGMESYQRGFAIGKIMKRP